MRFFIFFIFFITLHSKANSPNLLVRSSFFDGYLIPRLCFFLDAKPLKHNESLYLKLTCYLEPFHSEIWKIDLITNTSKLIYQSGIDQLLTDPVLSQNQIWWSEFNEAETKKINGFNGTELTSLPMPVTLKHSSVLDLIGGEKLTLRYKIGSELGIYQYDQKSGWDVLLSTTSEEFSYLFTPSLVSGGDIFFKARSNGLEENQPDSVVRLNQDFNKKIILKDSQADPTSPYITFRNTVVTFNQYWSVIAKTKEGEVLIIGESDHVVKTIELFKIFKEVAFFNWALTDDLKVVIRATHLDDSHQNLWLVSSNEVQKLLDINLPIQTDQGQALLIKNNTFMTSPKLSGDTVLQGVSLDMLDQPHLSESMGLISVKIPR